MTKKVKRTSPKTPRIRASGAALDSSGNILLLTHVRDRGSFRVLPGGGVDFGESIESALRREIHEELGIECKAGNIFAVGELIEKDRHVLDVFLTVDVQKNSRFRIQYSEGISDVGWFPIVDLDTIFMLPPVVIPVLKSLCSGNHAGISYLGRYDVLTAMEKEWERMDER